MFLHSNRAINVFLSVNAKRDWLRTYAILAASIHGPNVQYVLLASFWVAEKNDEKLPRPYLYIDLNIAKSQLNPVTPSRFWLGTNKWTHAKILYLQFKKLFDFPGFHLLLLYHTHQNIPFEENDLTEKHCCSSRYLYAYMMIPECYHLLPPLSPCPV